MGRLPLAVSTAALLLGLTAPACSGQDSGQTLDTGTLKPMGQAQREAQLYQIVVDEAQSLGLPIAQFDRAGLVASAYLMCDSHSLSPLSESDFVSSALAAWDRSDSQARAAAEAAGWTRDSMAVIAAVQYWTAMTLICPYR